VTDKTLRIGTAILVSQYFPPLNIIASQRAMRMAATLLNKFESVYVVTFPTLDLPNELLDPDFGRELLTEPRLNLFQVSPILTGYGFVKKTNLFHRLIGVFFTRLLCGPGVDWIPSLKETLLNLIKKNNVKLIISTGPPFAPFYTVTKLAARNCIPCIVDYRDLWSQNPLAPYPWFARRIVRHTIEKYTNKLATLITTVSEGCAKSILEVQPAANVEVLLNFPDKSYREKYRKSTTCSICTEFDQNKLNIVLAGSVYQECTCRLLVQALKAMPKEWRDQVIVHYYGLTSKVVENDFRSQDMLDNLIDHGFVNKLKAIQVVKNADLLLSLVSDRPLDKQNPVNGIMTTKVFDYFLSGKPIINIGPSGADLNLLSEKIGYTEFHSFEYFHVHELAEYLLKVLNDLPNLRKRNISVEMPDFSDNFELILNNILH
jgi:hypothetical protein